MTTATQDRPKASKRFKLLRGMHCETRVAGTKPDGTEKMEDRVYRAPGHPAYRPGDEIIETDLDLLKLNRRGYPPKFAAEGDPNAMRLPAHARVFDPEVETIEEFVARVRAEQQGGTDVENKVQTQGQKPPVKK